MVMPRTFGEMWNWLLGRDEKSLDCTPDPDKTVEAAWLPQWQGQMVTDELIGQGIPAVVTEDFTINPMLHTREPMSRIFVTQDRQAEAEALIEEIIGHPPRHRGL